MAVLCVVNTGPILIAVTTITEMVILYKYVEMNDDQVLINLKIRLACENYTGFETV